MSRNQVAKIFLVLGLLVLAYAAVRLVGGDGQRSSGGRDIGAAVTADVDLIRVTGPGEQSVELARDGDGWTVNGYPADTVLVGAASSGMDTARMGRLVARSATNHARLGVADDSTRLVEVVPTSGPAISFLLGGRGLEGRYVRFPGENDVFVVANESVATLDGTVEEWRDRIVAAVDTASVTRILVQRSDEGQTALARTEADSATVEWIGDGEAADAVVVGTLLESVAELSADGFPSDSVAFAVDFEQPAAVLDVYGSDVVGAPPVLSLLFLTAPDARDFLVRRADNPLVYRLSAARVEDLLPSRARLFPEAQ